MMCFIVCTAPQMQAGVLENPHLCSRFSVVNTDLVQRCSNGRGRSKLEGFLFGLMIKDIFCRNDVNGEINSMRKPTLFYHGTSKFKIIIVTRFEDAPIP